MKISCKSALLLVACLSSLQVHAQEKAWQDLLQGNGNFTAPPSEKNWKGVMNNQYTNEIKNENEDGDSYLEMVKISDQGFFDDGLVYLFNEKDMDEKYQPKHIRYWIQTNGDSADMESCDFRLTTYQLHVAPEPEKEKPEYVVEKSPIGPPGYDRMGMYDVGFVRLGYFNYMKLNTESMVMKFQGDEWYRIDLLIDWEEQQITIQSALATNTTVSATSRQPFFTKRKQRIDSANGISIYGLTPESVSRFKNIRVCTDFCPDEDESDDQLKSLFNGAAQIAQSLGVLALSLGLLLQ